MFLSHKLQGSIKPLYINEQFPRVVEQKRRILRPILKLGNELNKKCSLVVDRLIIEAKLYTVNNIGEIPYIVSSLTTKETNSYFMFSDRLSSNSHLFSRKALFTGEDSNKCSCTEQHYEHAQSMHSCSKTTALEIICVTVRVVMEHIGDTVRVMS